MSTGVFRYDVKGVIIREYERFFRGKEVTEEVSSAYGLNVGDFVNCRADKKKYAAKVVAISETGVGPGNVRLTLVMGMR